GEKAAAKDIKPGVAGYRDRIAMLKSAEARGGLKKEEVEQVDEAKEPGFRASYGLGRKGTAAKKPETYGKRVTGKGYDKPENERKAPEGNVAMTSMMPGHDERAAKFLARQAKGTLVKGKAQSAKQMEKEEITLKRKKVDISALVHQVAEINGPLIESVNGSLAVNVDKLPSTVELDEVHISNVLNNLIDNAVKYSPSSPQVEILARTQDQGISIQVKDHGMGMPKEALSNIFDAFYRVPTGNVHNVKGFGLGLSYVKKIVEAHGGKVHVKSKLGEGSTFEIYLPYVENA
ncbi:MAG: hypothetical protein RJA42_1770, partial [Bacteroidota bacterium]